MDCRTCQPTLIDLLYGELATDAAEAARAHLRECATCRAAYDKLGAGLRVARKLEIMEPPVHVEHKLLELAQARAVAIAEQRAAAAPPMLSPWRVAIDFVRRFAMASQVKMVAASALVVTVVLLALPLLLLPAKMSPVTMTAEPASSGPVPAVQPAAPAEEGESAFAEQTQRAAPQPTAAADLDRAKLRDEKKSAGPQSAANEARRARASSSSALADKIAMPAKGGGKASAGDDLILNGYRKDAPAPPPAASPRPFPSNDGALAQQSVSKKAKASEPSGALLGVGSSSPSGLSTRSSASGAGSAAVGGLSAGAAKPSSPAVDSAAPKREAEAGSMQPREKESLASRLQAARAIAQHDGCAAALSSYEQVVAAGSSTLEAGEALLEMAHCRITLGQPAIARALLERASRNPAVAPRARAMLESSAAPNAAPAAAEPPK